MPVAMAGVTSGSSKAAHWRPCAAHRSTSRGPIASGVALLVRPLPIFENSWSVFSSLLPLGPDGWEKITNQRESEVSTVDRYCMEHEIPFIDLLKSDTHGFDLEPCGCCLISIFFG
jgi:hypothetical protein